MNKKDFEQIEKQIAELRQMAVTIYGEPAPTMADLERRRDERIYKETWESLTPEQQQAFTRQQGTPATLRRLQVEARRLSDEQWEAAQLEAMNKAQDSTRWNGQIMRDRLPGADYDQLERQAEELEAKRAQRLAKRAELELTAEAWNTEQERILNSLETETAQIFMDLLRNQPTPLQALQNFVEASKPNPIADIAESTRLYDIAAQEQGIAQATAPRFMEGGESDKYYDQALEDMMKE